MYAVMPYAGVRRHNLLYHSPQDPATSPPRAVGRAPRAPAHTAVPAPSVPVVRWKAVQWGLACSEKRV